MNLPIELFSKNILFKDMIFCDVRCDVILRSIFKIFEQMNFYRTFQATGVKVFAREGSSYYHLFNISLFNEEGAICNEEISANELDGNSPQVN